LGWDFGEAGRSGITGSFRGVPVLEGIVGQDRSDLLGPRPDLLKTQHLRTFIGEEGEPLFAQKRPQAVDIPRQKFHNNILTFIYR
jgi:hypothetical protein